MFLFVTIRVVSLEYCRFQIWGRPGERCDLTERRPIPRGRNQYCIVQTLKSNIIEVGSGRSKASAIHN